MYSVVYYMWIQAVSGPFRIGIEKNTSAESKSTSIVPIIKMVYNNLHRKKFQST